MSLGAPAEHLTDTRTILAVAFAKYVLVNPAGIDEFVWEELKNSFTESELVALVFMISQYIAAHLFGYLLDIDPPGLERC